MDRRKLLGIYLSTAAAIVLGPAAASVLAAAPKSAPEYESFAMTHAGDAARGKALFADEHRLACARCHRVGGGAGAAGAAQVGPDLSAIGDKLGRKDLIEAIIAPSASIAEGYGTMIVETASGEIVDGIVKEATDTGVGLLDVEERLVRIAAGDIRERRMSTVSMMPQGLQNALTLGEFTDLIEYLGSLRAPATAAAESNGMPATIAGLKKPVALEPFIDPAHKFAHPVWLGTVPGVGVGGNGSAGGAWAVVEHETGKIWLLEKNGAAEGKTLFLDCGPNGPGAHGVLALAFHPDYVRNRRFFIVRQPVERGHFWTELLEGAADESLKKDSGRPLREVLRIDASTANHCGGGLEFGPIDHFLYVGMGDTGPQQDPHGNGQDMSLLRGKMLRIDVDHRDAGKGYAAPPDNPFVNQPGVRPEIWASGLREPWRYSFDRITGELWVGDVGQDLYEEVDIVRRGENYGWNVYEGFAPFSNRYRRAGERYAPPVFAYTRKYGVSVTGGYVYRGDRASSFYGVYVFGDFQTRRIFGLSVRDGRLDKVRQIGTAPQRIVSFAADADGHLYLLGYEGMIYRVTFSGTQFE